MTRNAAEWKVLRTAIDGRLVLPDSSDYGLARKPEMVRFHNVLPEAVVLCRCAADVSATIAFARRHRLRTAIRSGGHSVAGRSTTEGIVIDVTPMNAVAVADGVATVGAGVRLGTLYDALEPLGITIPAGSSHSVGIAGLTLGGGLGILGRKYGLTCDHLLRAQIVLADGHVVECDEHENEDLFWALRGAGCGNFGVVTSFVFRTVPAPPASIFHLVWPFTHASQLIQAWQDWAPAGPDELDATLRLSSSGNGDRPPLVDIFGAVLGSDADAAELLDELIARAGTDPRQRPIDTCPTERRSGTSTVSDPLTIGTWSLLRPRHRRRTTCSPSQSSCDIGSAARRSQPSWRTSPAGWPRGSRAR
jgi:FAD/FMN-containing dehydrogenase